MKGASGVAESFVQAGPLGSPFSLATGRSTPALLLADHILSENVLRILVQAVPMDSTSSRGVPTRMVG